MGPSNRREREKEALRTRILDAARELFARDGYEAVTMRAIADRIEYSPRTIYLHFQDKEDLVRELCRHDFQVFGAELARAARIQDPLSRIKAMGRGYAAFGLQNPNHYRLMFMSGSPDYEGKGEEAWKGNPEVDAYALLLGTVQEALEKGLLRAAYADAELVAQTIWAGIHGVVALALAKEGDPWVDWRPISARVEAMSDAIVDGLSASPAPAPKKGR
ncbi:MAG TPA: TetR/AcrR family transcriptional regulator [Holophagaceae bacterium]|nr:TetR/AcrR family transcriptional regulator [Holophagaceae bacterium]